MLFSTPFIISQILVMIAMIFDFLSFQFLNRKTTFLCLIVSASLISTHYFFLSRIAAGVIVCISVLRFIACYFSTNKKLMLLFIALNAVSLIFTYSEIYDLIIFVGITIFIMGNFQSNNKLMRLLMMLGTSFVVIYNLLIFSPMGVVLESCFLLSNIIGYYRFYIKRN